MLSLRGDLISEIALSAAGKLIAKKLGRHCWRKLWVPLLPSCSEDGIKKWLKHPATWYGISRWGMALRDVTKLYRRGLLHCSCGNFTVTRSMSKESQPNIYVDAPALTEAPVMKGCTFMTARNLFTVLVSVAPWYLVDGRAAVTSSTNSGEEPQTHRCSQRRQISRQQPRTKERNLKKLLAKSDGLVKTPSSKHDLEIPVQQKSAFGKTMGACMMNYLCIYIYIYIYICIFIYIYICIYIYMFIYIYICIYIYISIYVYLYIYICICVCCMRPCVPVCSLLLHATHVMHVLYVLFVMNAYVFVSLCVHVCVLNR